MKSGKLTNTLLALIFLALLAHLVAPLFAAGEAKAVGSDAAPPAAVAAVAGFPALDNVASQIANGLKQIAQSNQQIASAIREHARSNERIAQSLDGVADGVKALELRAPASTRAPVPPGRSTEEQPLDEDWWQGLIPE